MDYEVSYRRETGNWYVMDMTTFEVVVEGDYEYCCDICNNLNTWIDEDGYYDTSIYEEFM